MAEHTPGPWKVEGSKKYPEHHSVSSDEWSGLAIVFTSGSWVDDPEGLANAHLIAAAPDMLEALEDIITQFRILKNVGHDTRIADDLISKAIHKAKGES